METIKRKPPNEAIPANRYPQKRLAGNNPFMGYFLFPIAAVNWREPKPNNQMKRRRNRTYRKATPDESKIIMEDIVMRGELGRELARILQEKIPLEKIKEVAASLPENRRGRYLEQIREIEERQERERRGK